MAADWRPPRPWRGRLGPPRFGRWGRWPEYAVPLLPGRGPRIATILDLPPTRGVHKFPNLFRNLPLAGRERGETANARSHHPR